MGLHSIFMAKRELFFGHMALSFAAYPQRSYLAQVLIIRVTVTFLGHVVEQDAFVRGQRKSMLFAVMPIRKNRCAFWL